MATSIESMTGNKCTCPSVIISNVNRMLRGNNGEFSNRPIYAYMPSPCVVMVCKIMRKNRQKGPNQYWRGHVTNSNDLSIKFTNSIKS